MSAACSVAAQETFEPAAVPAHLQCSLLKPGDKLQPALIKFKGSNLDIREILSDQVGVILGLPGAFTPICTNLYLENLKRDLKILKQQGIGFVACLLVNDPFVVRAWAEHAGFRPDEDDLVFLSDPLGELSRSYGLLQDFTSVGLGLRCRRCAIIAGPQARVQWVGLDEKSLSTIVIQQLECLRAEGLIPSLKDNESSTAQPDAPALIEPVKANPFDAMQPVHLDTAASGSMLSEREDETTAQPETTGAELYDNVIRDVHSTTVSPSKFVAGCKITDLPSTTPSSDIPVDPNLAYTSDFLEAQIQGPAHPPDAEGVKYEIKRSQCDLLDFGAAEDFFRGSSRHKSRRFRGQSSKQRIDEGDEEEDNSENDAENRSDGGGGIENEEDDNQTISSESSAENVEGYDEFSSLFAIDIHRCAGGCMSRLLIPSTDESCDPADESLDVKLVHTTPSECRIIREPLEAPCPKSETSAHDPLSATAHEENISYNLSVRSISEPMIPIRKFHFSQIELESQRAGFIVVDGQRYFAREIHFHAPSPHRIKGRKHSPLEMHVLHLPDRRERALREPVQSVAILVYRFLWEPENSYKPCKFINSLVDVVLEPSFRSNGHPNIVDFTKATLDLQRLSAENTMAAFYRYATVGATVCPIQPRASVGVVSGSLADDIQTIWIVARNGIPLALSTFHQCAQILGVPSIKPRRRALTALREGSGLAHEDVLTATTPLKEEEFDDNMLHPEPAWPATSPIRILAGEDLEPGDYVPTPVHLVVSTLLG